MIVPLRKLSCLNGQMLGEEKQWKSWRISVSVNGIVSVQEMYFSWISTEERKQIRTITIIIQHIACLCSFKFCQKRAAD